MVLCSTRTGGFGLLSKPFIALEDLMAHFTKKGTLCGVKVYSFTRIFLRLTNHTNLSWHLIFAAQSQVKGLRHETWPKNSFKP